MRELTDQELERCASVAAETSRLHDIAARSAPYERVRQRTPAATTAPTLHLDDVSEIPFLEGIVGMEFYQLRARIRADDGDLFAATCDEVPGYEGYNQELLGLGAPTFIHAPPAGGHPSAVARACLEGPAFGKLVEIARRAGSLRVHPYMGATPVWEMALELSRAAGVPVSVVGPPPAVTWVANDKAALTTVAHAVCDDGVLGDVVTPETHITTDAHSLGEALGALAQRHERVALKMTKCASAMGNEVFDSATVRALDGPGLEALAARFLRDKEWIPGEPALAVAWLAIESSPSTQLWVPPLGHGQPRLDGVYEQLLEGEECVFLGSVPSRLGPEIDQRMGLASLRVARVYQELGYVGRCSFDFIISGGEPAFVECNGRWGGTSTPMHLLDRLFPAGRPACRAQDYLDPRLAGVPFERILEAIGSDLYDQRVGRGRFILYNVGCQALYGKFDVIALGEDIDSANRALEEDFPGILEGCGG